MRMTIVNVWRSLIALASAGLMMALAACPSESDDNAPPGPVTNPMAADGASDGEVNLSWTNPDDDDLASVEITWTPSGTGHGSQPVEVAADADPNDSATISGLTPGTLYEFTLTAVDEDDNRSTSATVTATATQIPPNSVSGLMATSGSGNGEVDLTWTNPVDTRFARVEITWTLADGMSTTDGPTQPVAVSGTPEATGSRTIADLSPGREYTFTLTALDGSGAVISDRQAMATVTASDMTPPGEVTSPTATAHATQSGRIELSWSNPTDADLASVEIGWTPSGAGHGSQPVTVAASATPNDSASIGGLTPATEYTFTLTAVDASGNSSAGVDTAAVEAPHYPRTPSVSWPSSLSGTATRTATEGVEIGADITAYMRFFGNATPGTVRVGNAASSADPPTVTLSYGSGALASAAFGTGGTSITFSNFVDMAPHIDAVLDDSNDSAFVDEPISRGWSWQGYGVWMDTDGATGVGAFFRGRFEAASFGAETEGAFIPTTGSATFVGRSAGYHARSTSALIYASGPVEAVVNFGSATITLTTSGHTGVRVGTTTTDTGDADLNWSGSLSWTEGSNDLTGTLTAPGPSGNRLTGNAFGRFYGPNGEELGLVFDLAGLSSSEDLRYIGAMGARSCAADPAPTSGPTGECP